MARVLIAHKNWRIVGGVERHLFEVADWLTSRGHEVLPFSVNHPDNVLDSEHFVSDVDMRATALKGRAKAAERALIGSETRRKAKALLRRKKIDVAYVGHVYHQMGFSFLRDLRNAGVPVVLSLHDYKLGCANYQLLNEKTGEDCRICIERKGAYLYGPLATGCSDTSTASSALLTLEGVISRWSKSYASAAKAVTVVNDLQREAAVSFGIPDDIIIRVPHYVSAARGGVRWNPQRQNKIALFVGRLSPEKGVDTLIRAAAESKVEVRIAGDGRLRSELEHLAQSLRAPVTFLGWLKAAEVELEMEAADALVLPSSSEVWGLVVNEAISVGLPVIASSVGVLTEILGDGRGHLFETGNIEELADLLRGLQRGDPAFRSGAVAVRAFSEEHLSRGRWEERLGQAFALAGVPV